MIERIGQTDYTLPVRADSHSSGPVPSTSSSGLAGGGTREVDLSPTAKADRQDNKLRPEDRAGHDWYRFVLSFPPHFVRDRLAEFGLGPGSHVLDPFCGTGTTLVECKKLGSPEEVTPEDLAAYRRRLAE